MNPTGGTQLRVDVLPGSGLPVAGSGRLLVDSGSGFQLVSMTETSPGIYQVDFPSAPCGADVDWYVEADVQGGGIDRSGSLSLSANDLVLEASGLPASQPGVFFYGPNQVQIAFGNGVRCVGGTLRRLPVVNSDGGGNSSFAIDYGNLPGGDVFSAGQTVHFQHWYRDPAGGGSSFNLSDGLSLTFCQ